MYAIQKFLMEATDDGGHPIKVVASDDSFELVVWDPVKRIWMHPSGLSEVGEDARDAALRELSERTGYNVSDVTKLSYTGVKDGYHVFKVNRLYLKKIATPGKQTGQETMIKWVYYRKDTLPLK